MAVSSKDYQSFLNNLVAKNIISKNEHQSLSNSKAVDGYNQLKKTHNQSFQNVIAQLNQSSINQKKDGVLIEMRYVLLTVIQIG